MIEDKENAFDTIMGLTNALTPQEFNKVLSCLLFVCLSDMPEDEAESSYDIICDILTQR